MQKLDELKSQLSDKEAETSRYSEANVQKEKVIFELQSTL